MTCRIPFALPVRCGLGIVALLAVTLSAASGATTARVGESPRRAVTRTVDMKGFRYRPDSIRLAAGDTVIWVNSDDEPHTITLDTATFDSGDIAPGSRFRWVFRQRGRLRYHCEVHPRMKGLLDVR